MNFEGKIVHVRDISNLHKVIQAKKIVLVGGCFDLFHYGHHYFLSRAKEEGESLVVLLESDFFIERAKKRKPVHSQKQRAEIIAALEYVDCVILLDPMKKPDEEYTEIIRGVTPSVIAYTQGDPQKEKKIHIAQMVGAVHREISYLSSFSSSQIVSYASILRD